MGSFRSQDTYRVGTMLEMVRELTTHLADHGNRVKVCIQGSMGEGIFTGLPLSLSGTMAIMTRMDWPEVSTNIATLFLSGA